MMNWFDYIYYRLSKFYMRWDGKGGGTARIGVSMVQAMLIGNLGLIVIKILYTREETKFYAKTGARIGVAIFVVILLLNYFRYKKTYNSFRKRWKDEAAIDSRRRGYLVILTLTLPWILLIVLGVFF